MLIVNTKHKVTVQVKHPNLLQLYPGEPRTEKVVASSSLAITLRSMREIVYLKFGSTFFQKSRVLLLSLSWATFHYAFGNACDKTPAASAIAPLPSGKLHG